MTDETYTIYTYNRATNNPVPTVKVVWYYGTFYTSSNGTNSVTATRGQLLSFDFTKDGYAWKRASVMWGYPVDNSVIRLSGSTYYVPLDSTGPVIPPSADYYTVNCSADAYGQVNPSGSTQMLVGQTFYATATPNLGYKFKEWTLDGEVQSTTSQTFSLSGPEPNTLGFSKLRVSGTRILNEQNQEITLTGFNVHGAWSDWSNDEQDYVAANEYDLNWMRAKGCNCVRVVVYWEYIETADGVYDSDKLAALDAFIELCEQKQVWVLLDNHQWGYSTHFDYSGITGVGIPAWAGPTNYTSAQLTQFQTDMWNETGGASSTLNHMTDFWKYLANRYKDYTCIFAYDLFNEAWNPWISDDVYTAIMTYFDDTLAPAIRTVDSDTIIAFDSVNVSVDKNPTHSTTNVMYVVSFYDYCQTFGGGTYDATKLANIGSLMSTYYTRFVSELGTPLMFSEVGANFVDYEDDLLWVNAVLQQQQNYFGKGAHWTYWTFGKIAENPGEGWYPRTGWTPQNPYDLTDMPVVDVVDDYTAGFTSSSVGDLVYTLVAFFEEDAPDEPDEPEEPDPGYFSVNAEATTGGTVMPSGDQTEQEGETITFTHEADEGYSYKYSLINGTTKVYAPTGYSFSLAAGSKYTFLVVFQKTWTNAPNLPMTPSTTASGVTTRNRVFGKVLKKTKKRAKPVDLSKILGKTKKLK